MLAFDSVPRPSGAGGAELPFGLTPNYMSVVVFYTFEYAYLTVN